jgi:hypothetical protein
MVVNRLMKQVARLHDDILPRLADAYENKENLPVPDLIEIFLSYCSYLSSRGSNIFVMFDAFDECAELDDQHIIDIIRKLGQSRIRVYVTTRHHLREKLVSGMKELKVQQVEIKASDADVRNYLTRQIEKHSRASNEARMKEIVEAAIKSVNGMYLLECPHDMLMYIGSSWQG